MPKFTVNAKCEQWQDVYTQGETAFWSCSHTPWLQKPRKASRVEVLVYLVLIWPWLQQSRLSEVSHFTAVFPWTRDKRSKCSCLHSVYCTPAYSTFYTSSCWHWWGEKVSNFASENEKKNQNNRRWQSFSQSPVVCIIHAAARLQYLFG